LRDQTSERATNPPSKICTYLWKLSPETTYISGMLKLPTYESWSFLTASQSSQVSLHKHIYRSREAKCSQLPAFQTQAGFITSLHPHHLNQPNFSHWYEGFHHCSWETIYFPINYTVQGGRKVTVITASPLKTTQPSLKRRV